MELSEVRKNIDRVDGEIRKLFVERMSLADQVACIKAETEDVIYKPDRKTPSSGSRRKGWNRGWCENIRRSSKGSWKSAANINMGGLWSLEIVSRFFMRESLKPPDVCAW